MHDFSLFYAPFSSAVLLAFVPIIFVIIIWTIAIKGYSLWHAARNDQKAWFATLLIINTLGLLELVYLIWFRSNQSSSSISSSPAVSSETQG
jgi:hypothetical protein